MHPNALASPSRVSMCMCVCVCVSHCGALLYVRRRRAHTHSLALPLSRSLLQLHSPALSPSVFSSSAWLLLLLPPAACVRKSFSGRTLCESIRICALQQSASRRKGGRTRRTTTTTAPNTLPEPSPSARICSQAIGPRQWNHFLVRLLLPPPLAQPSP